MIIFIIFFMSLGVFIWALNKIINYKKTLSYITEFEKYQIALRYHMDQAYQMVYRGGVLGYSLEGISLSDELFETYSKDFVKLTMKLIGKRVGDELISMYGTYEELASNIIIFFSNRLVEDTILDTVRKKKILDERND